MKLKLAPLACVTMGMLFSVSALAQLTIDATGPHKKPRETSVSRCGGMGRKLPVQFVVEVPGTAVTEKGKTVVEFVLTNPGKEGLRIPVSPDPGPVEPPAGSQADYSFKQLSLYVTSCGSPSELPCAIARRQEILRGGAQLYGNEDSATLVTLAPGESLRVRAQVALPPVSGVSEKSRAVFVAKAMLVDQTVTKTPDGKSFMDCVGVGAISASSPEYTPEALFNSRK